MADSRKEHPDSGTRTVRLKGRIRSVTRRAAEFSFTDREWEQMEALFNAQYRKGLRRG